MQRQEISTEYQLNNSASLKVGLGQYTWKINGLAKGVLDQGIRVSTKANGNGDDNYYLLGGKINFGSIQTKINYYNYYLTASNKVNLNEINIVLLFDL